MLVYRFCLRDRSGRVLTRHSIACDDDDEALELASDFRHCHDVEIWERARRVARVALEDNRARMTSVDTLPGGSP